MQPKTDLTVGANVVYQGDTGRPTKIRGHRFILRPGERLPFPGVGNFAYIAQADGPVEIALNEDADFMPWDTALATKYDTGEVFPIVWLRTPGDAVVTGILYVGYKVSITDHRLHHLGELVVKLENQKTNGFSGAQLLQDENWLTLVPPSGSKREVWLSVERADGGEEPVRAWWSMGGDRAKVPAREIGLSLDGITRLPFSDRIDIATDAAGAGVAVVRYIIVVYSVADDGDLPYTPEPTENLVIPPASGLADIAGIVTGGIWKDNNQIAGWADAANLWKLFDGETATSVSAGSQSSQAWVTEFNFGRAVDLSRIELLWGNSPITENAPAIIHVHKSTDGERWTQVIGPDLNSKTANCTRPASPGQVIFSRALGSGEMVTRYLKITVKRSWRTLSQKHDWSDGAVIGEIKLYEHTIV